MPTIEEMRSALKASGPSIDEMRSALKNQSSPQPQQPQSYDYSNVGQVASDLGNQVNEGIKQLPEALGSSIGLEMGGNVGSGIGATLGKAVSEFGSGIDSAIKHPKQFIQDLGRLPTKEQVIDQVNKYLNTFSLNTTTPYLVNKLAGGAEKLPENIATKAEKLAENATGATGVQSAKFKPGSGRELLDRGTVAFGDTAQDVAKKSGDAVTQAESRINNVLQVLDDKGVKVDQNAIVKNIQDQMTNLAEDPAKADTVKSLSKIVDNIINTGKSEVNASAAETTKRGYNAGSKAWLNPSQDSATNEANKIAYRAYMGEVEKTANKFNIDYGDTFKEAKKTFGLMKPIEEAAIKRGNQLKQSPIGGFLDTAAMVAGGTLGGPVGLAKGVALATARRAIAPRIASSEAVTLDKVSKLLSGLPEYAKMAKDNPQTFTALANGVLNSFQDKGPAKWQQDGELRLIDSGIPQEQIDKLKLDKNGQELLVEASRGDKSLKAVIEKLKDRGPISAKNTYPMSLYQNGHMVTISNDKDYQEAISEGWKAKK